jgi:hypothetical protein
MGAMADGWLPPTAPGAKPPPRFDAAPEHVVPAQAEPAPAAPTFVLPSAAGRGERNRTAVWAIALGITALALLVLSLGSLFILTLPCSAAAWVLAVRARRQIDSGTTRQGEGQATAALWLGRIGVIAGVAAMVVFIALVASGFDFEQFRDELEQELDQRRERRDGGNGQDVRTSLEHLRAAAGAWLGFAPSS